MLPNKNAAEVDSNNKDVYIYTVKKVTLIFCVRYK